jgi:hypothetical protein
VKTTMIFAALMVATAGCWHHGVVMVSGPAPVVVVEEDDRAWDGAVWITYHHHHHGPGCGHYYHHGAWHVYESSYVYLQPRHAHYGMRIEPPGPEHRSPPPDHPPHHR